MYAKRIQIINYGPIEDLDIDLPFDGEVPKPVVLVGANGSGKSILLSHIVNGLISAKDRAYPESTEIETGRVFKLRSGTYIRSGTECYFAKVDFDDGLSIGELRSRQLKRNYQTKPTELSGEAATAYWDQMESDRTDHLDPIIFNTNQNRMREIFSRNCALYFPPNRFEEPAWLNEHNLIAQAKYMDLRRVQGYTTRKIINYSPLRDNQNWLFEVAYDRAVFETQTINFPLKVQDGGQSTSLPIQIGPSGNATTVYGIALQIVQGVMRDNQSTRFGIGQRLNRVVSLEGAAGNIVPNIFQLSSGETSLLNLFLCILRDFDLSDASLVNAAEIRGIVVVDEIDLHLHAVHQHEILPRLMQMFPRVQFIVSTHSPLFVLGLAQTYGEDSFALYRMPQGRQISPEEFTEFGDAYQAFRTTSRFSDDIRVAVRDAQSPILYMEGKTDIQYLKQSAALFGKETVLEELDIDDGGGTGNLTNIWKALLKLSDNLVPRKVVLLFDCDYPGVPDAQGNRFKCKTPFQDSHPVKKGIENLFGPATLEKALAFNKAFINVEPGGTAVYDGVEETIQEKWVVNEKLKTDLCDWLCENGTAEDFRHFQVIFDLLEGALGNTDKEPLSSA